MTRVMTHGPDLLARRLVVLAGKGGVGRTTVAAALALGAARRGKRVLLLQVNAKERLSRLLGCDPVGERVTPVGDGLWAANMTPEAALRERGLQVLRFQAVYKAVFENRTVKHFLRAVPGLDQFAMLGKAWWHTTERSPGTDQPRYDLVVLDAPATGHALTMLRLPLSILESTPEGPLTRDARKVWNLLRDPLQTAVVLVTLAEDMPANEAIELGRALGGDLGLPLAQLVINALYPSRFCADRVAGAALLRLLDSERRDGDGAQPPEAQPSDAALGPVLSRARMAANRRALNERYLRRLARELPLPQILLPYLFVADFGLSQVEKLSSLLLDQVTATPLAEGQHE